MIDVRVAAVKLTQLKLLFIDDADDAACCTSKVVAPALTPTPIRQFVLFED